MGWRVLLIYRYFSLLDDNVNMNCTINPQDDFLYQEMQIKILTKYVISVKEYNTVVN
jgi:hypothetical protein